MEKSNYKIEPLTEYFQGTGSGDTLGVKFINKDTGHNIVVRIDSNYPEYITIAGEDCLEVMPWSTNMIRVRHSKE